MSQSISNLPVGAKVKFGSFQVATETPQPIEWIIVRRKTTRDFDTGNVVATEITLLSSKILALRCFDANETESTDTYIKSNGNARYSLSNVRQWLNSRAAAGEWYSAQHSTDVAPRSSTVKYGPPYEEMAGFLNAFSVQEYAAILDTTVSTPVATSVIADGYENSVDKVFLPSYTEVGLTATTVSNDGTSWGYFKSDEARVCYMTDACFKYTTSSQMPGAITDGWLWLLRTGVTSSTSSIRAVSPAGAAFTGNANYGHIGVRPALGISTEYMVSDTTDADGCYTFLFNESPSVPSSITVPSSILGGRTAVITWGASTDPDGEIANYVLERRSDSGDWVTIYTGLELTYTDTITYGWTTVQYRVRSCDNVGAYSEYRTSEIRDVYNNKAPVISGTDSNLGTKIDAFTQTYSVTDAEEDEVTVTEVIDNKSVRSYVVTLGNINTFAVDGETWLALSNGTHTMTIEATDSFGNSSMRSYVFTKSVTSFTVQNATPYGSDSRPTRIKVSVARNIPNGATFSVRTCNNGYDASPTWEDITENVLDGTHYVFENESKTSASWGVIVKCEVNRGTGEGACYISQIGGNFD